MQITKKKFTAWVVIAFLVGVLLAGTAAVLISKGLTGHVTMSKDDYTAMSAVYEKYGKLEQLNNAVEKYYYKDFNDEDLVDGACKGLISGLDDPYSAYMTKSEYESWEATATGEYSGIGVTFAEDEHGNYVIVGVTKDSPAEKGGLIEGDFIISVDGKKYDDMELMAAAIRGEQGTKVEIGYYRDGEEKKLSLTRADIKQHSVEYEMLEGSVGYIKVSSFINNTADDFDKALQALTDKGAESLIIDLRDNGGGLVDSCVDIADEFLDEGIVTYMEDKNKKKTEYKAEDGKTELKTTVLVNKNSASASEILAAALQDNGITLVGENTYGKGVVQSTAKLKDGSAIKLTVMQYFSPKGRAIHEKGIKPDYELTDDKDTDTDEQLDKALELL